MKGNYPAIYLMGMRKRVQHLSQDCRSPGPDLNPGPTKYKTGLLIA